jgi:hypothetical protein
VAKEVEAPPDCLSFVLSVVIILSVVVTTYKKGAPPFPFDDLHSDGEDANLL